jgi:hypothetical protein
MPRPLLGALLLLAACSKSSGDECQRMMDKSAPVLGDMARLRGREIGDADRKKLVAHCRTSLKEGKRDPAMDCVLAASTDTAVRDCYIKGFESYAQKAKKTEAELQLNKLGKSAKVEFMVNDAFPVGKVGPTPATPCCAQPDKKCAPDPQAWADPVWQALEFQIDEPHLFQYSYESDGKTFTATAVGDLACDGKPTTHTATGTVTADGTPQVSQQ